jgi:hypothetical protein
MIGELHSNYADKMICFPRQNIEKKKHLYWIYLIDRLTIEKIIQG